jgi:HEAT repeat protein
LFASRIESAAEKAYYSVMDFMINGLPAGFGKGAGIVLAVLLVVDAFAFVAGFVLILIFRLRRRFVDARSSGVVSDTRVALEKFIAGDRKAAGESLRLLESLPLHVQAGLFLRYSRLIAGESLAEMVGIFKESGLLDWARLNVRSPRWWKKLRGLALLELFPPEEAERILGGFLDDRNAIVRTTAVQMAYIFASPDIIRKLVTMLECERNITLFVLKDAIIRIGTKASFLMNGFLSGNHDEKLLAEGIDVVGAIKDPAHIDALIRILREHGGAAQASAARALSAFPEEKVAKELRLALKAKNEQTRAMAARSLGKIQDSHAVDALAEAFTDECWAVRFHCACALRAIGGPAESRLEKLKEHRDPQAAAMANYVATLSDFALQWAT